MTASVHAVTGAAVALAVRRPELAIPLAFISHFAVDALPHYEPQEIEVGLNSGTQKIKLASFKLILTSDLLIFAAMLVFLPIMLVSSAQWWVVLTCMAVGALPDLTWGWHIYREAIGKKVTSPNWLTRFHIWIHWEVRWQGAAVELVWAALMVIVIVWRAK